MSQPMDEQSDVVLSLTLHEDGTLEVWQPQGTTGVDFAAALRRIADQFESGEVTRVK